MGILTSFAQPREERSRVQVAHPRDPVLASWFQGSNTLAGVPVTPDTAMRVTAVYACVSLIAETIASVPLHVLRREGKNNAKAVEHPLYRVLHDTPTPMLTSFEWRELMVSHTALRGDSYARIMENNAGQVTALEPLQPAFVTPELSRAGTRRYIYQPPNGPRQVLLDDEVLRIPHKMMDGMTSLSPIGVHRETIGAAMAAQRFQSAFYGNSVSPKGALEIPAEVSGEAAEALRSSFEKRHRGPENAGRLVILDGGMKWQEIGMSMRDAQYIEAQQFSVQDIARIFLVPPHKVGDLSKATFSNIEHQAIEFVTGTILHWVRRIESRMNAYLLSERDRQQNYFVAFDLNGLLRGDSAARAAFYKTLFYIGAISPNEIRGKEDMNPYDGGDRYYVQGATVPIDKVDEQVARGLSRPMPREDER